MSSSMMIGEFTSVALAVGRHITQSTVTTTHKSRAPRGTCPSCDLNYIREEFTLRGNHIDSLNGEVNRLRADKEEMGRALDNANNQLTLQAGRLRDADTCSKLLEGRVANIKAGFEASERTVTRYRDELATTKATLDAVNRLNITLIRERDQARQQQLTVTIASVPEAITRELNVSSMGTVPEVVERCVQRINKFSIQIAYLLDVCEYRNKSLNKVAEAASLGAQANMDKDQLTSHINGFIG